MAKKSKAVMLLDEQIRVLQDVLQCENSKVLRTSALLDQAQDLKAQLLKHSVKVATSKKPRKLVTNIVERNTTLMPAESP